MCTNDHYCESCEDEPPDDEETPGECAFLYSRSHDTLPDGLLQRIRDEAQLSPDIETDDQSESFVLLWPDLTVIVTVLSLLERLVQAEGHCQFIGLIYEGKLPRRGRQMIKRLQATRLAIRFDVVPGQDKELRTETVFRRLCIELDPLFYFQASFYDGRGRLLLDTDRNFDREAKLE